MKKSNMNHKWTISIILILLTSLLFSQNDSYQTKEQARLFLNKKLESINSIFRLDKNFNVFSKVANNYSSVDLKKVFVHKEQRGDYAFALAIDCVSGDCWKQKANKGVVTYSLGISEVLTNSDLESVEQIIETFQFIQTKLIGYAPTHQK